MLKITLRSIYLAALSAAALTACVQPTNRYDLESPTELQAKAQFSGSIVLTGPSALADSVQLAAEGIELSLVSLGSEDLPRSVPLQSAQNENDETEGNTDASTDCGEGENAGQVRVTRTFLANDLPPGRYRLEIVGLPETFLGSRSYDMNLGPADIFPISPLVFVRSDVAAQGTLRGRMTGGASAAPAKVTLYRLDPCTGSITAMGSQEVDEDGDFSFSEMDSGNYSVLGEGEDSAPAYAMDEQVTDTEPSVQLQTPLVLSPISAVLTFPDAVPLVETQRYSADTTIPLDLFAFGGDSHTGGVRLSHRPDFLLEDDSIQEFSTFGQAASLEVSIPDGAADGQTVLYAQFEATSPAGFRFLSDVYSRSLTLDRTPPEILSAAVPGVEPVDGVLYLTSEAVAPSLEILAEDATSGVHQVAIYEGEQAPAPGSLSFETRTSSPGQVSVNIALPSAEEGPHTYWVFVKDRAGNLSEASKVELVVDTVQPVAAVTSFGSEAFLLATAAIEISTDDEDVGQVAVSVAEGVSTPTQFQPYTGAPMRVVVDLLPGIREQTISVRLLDFAGNASEVVTVPITIEGELQLLVPALTSDLDAQVRVVGPAAYRARFWLGDGISEVEVPAYPEAAALETSLRALFPDETTAFDGQYFIYAQVRDGAGNEVTLPARTVEIDTTAPVAPTLVLNPQADGSSSPLTNALSVQLQVGVGFDTDVVKMYVSNNDSDPALTEPQTFASRTTQLLSDGDGEKIFQVRVQDRAGNLSEISTAVIELDRQSPTFSVNAVGATSFLAPTARISVASTNTDISYIAYEVAQASTTPANFVSFTGSPMELQIALLPGVANQVISVRLKDGAGNAANTETLNVSLDATAQLIAPAFTNNENATIRIASEAALTARFWVSDGENVATIPEYPTTNAKETMLAQIVTGDGEYQISAQIKDGAGNELLLPARTLVLDTTPPNAPTVSINPQADGSSGSITNALSVQLVINPGTDDDVTHMYISTDGSPPTSQSVEAFAATTTQLLAAADGTKTFRVQLQDRAGNISDIGEASIALDTTKPTVALASDYGTSFLAALGKVSVSTSDDDANALAYSISASGPSTPADYRTFTGTSSLLEFEMDPASSTQYLSVRMRDEAGNVSDTVSLTLTLNTEAQLLAPSLTKDANAAISVASNAATTARFWVGQETSAATLPAYPTTDAKTTTLDTLISEDGTYLIFAQAKDGAGNEVLLPNLEITRDTTAPAPPSVVINDQGDGTGSETTTSTSVQLAIDIGSDSDVARMYITTDGSDPSTATPVAFAANSTQLLSAADGTKTIRVRVEDEAGNLSPEASDTIMMDTTAPVAVASTVTNGSTVLQPFTKIEVSGAASDIAAVAYAVDSGITTPVEYGTFTGDTGSPMQLNIQLLPGVASQQISVRVKDVAGNESATVSIPITLDTTAILTAPSLTNARTDLIQVTGNAVMDAKFWVDGNTEPTSFAGATQTTVAVISGDVDGTYIVNAKVKDGIGNELMMPQTTIVYDTTPPSIDKISLDNGNKATAFVSALLSIAMSTDADLGDASTMRITTDGSDAGTATAIPFAPNSTVLLPGGDGAKTVKVEVLDAAGNASAEVSAAIRLDTTPPSTPTVNPPSATIRGPCITLTIQRPSEDEDENGENPKDVSRYEFSTLLGKKELELESGTWAPDRTPPKNRAIVPYAMEELRFDECVQLSPNLHLNRNPPVKTVSVPVFRGTTNEICVAGIDDAGNRGAPYCVVLTEDSTKPILANGIDFQLADLHGDSLVWYGRDGLWLTPLRTGAPTSFSDTARMQKLFRPNLFHGNDDDLVVAISGNATRTTAVVGPVQPDQQSCGFEECNAPGCAGANTSFCIAAIHWTDDQRMFPDTATCATDFLTPGPQASEGEPPVEARYGECFMDDGFLRTFRLEATSVDTDDRWLAVVQDQNLFAIDLPRTGIFGVTHAEFAGTATAPPQFVALVDEARKLRVHNPSAPNDPTFVYRANVNASTGTPQPIELCPNTRVKVANGTILLCAMEEESHGNFVARIYLSKRNTSGDWIWGKLSDVAPASRSMGHGGGAQGGDGGGNNASYLQPFISEQRIAYVTSDHELWTLDTAALPDTPTAGVWVASGGDTIGLRDLICRQSNLVGANKTDWQRNDCPFSFSSTTLADQNLEVIETFAFTPTDLSGHQLAYTANSRSDVQVLRDIYVAQLNLDENDEEIFSVQVVSEELIPESGLRIDGDRIIYRNDETEELLLVEQSRSEVIQARRELVFDPITTGQNGYTAWFGVRESDGDLQSALFVNRSRPTASDTTPIDEPDQARLATAKCSDLLMFPDHGRTPYALLADGWVIWLEPGYESDGTTRSSAFIPTSLESSPYTYVGRFAKMDFDGCSTKRSLLDGSTKNVELSDAKLGTHLATDPGGTGVFYTEVVPGVSLPESMPKDCRSEPYFPVNIMYQPLDADSSTMAPRIVNKSKTLAIDSVYAAYGPTGGSSSEPVLLVQNCGESGRTLTDMESLIYRPRSESFETLNLLKDGSTPYTDRKVQENVVLTYVEELGEWYAGYQMYCSGGGTCQYGRDDGAQVCALERTEIATGQWEWTCKTDSRVVLQFAPSIVDGLQIDSTGLVAFLSDEDTLTEVVVYDLLTHRRIFATPVEPSEGDRSGLYLRNGVLIYRDKRGELNLLTRMTGFRGPIPY